MPEFATTQNCMADHAWHSRAHTPFRTRRFAVATRKTPDARYSFRYVRRAGAYPLNTSFQGTTHLVRRTLDGVVGSLNQEG
jgi:hypothetical protein